MDEQNLGLRERKRIETRRELEAATIALVIRDGLEQTTIEAISERANVSPRTFFNYFDSKEEAVLGLHDITVSDETIAKHIRDHQDVPIVESVVTLMVNIFAPALINPMLHKSRMQIIRQHPQLLERQISRAIDMTKQLTNAVQQIASASASVEINETQAEVLLALCMSGIRISIREWIKTGKKISSTKLTEQAIKIIKEVTNTL